MTEAHTPPPPTKPPESGGTAPAWVAIILALIAAISSIATAYVTTRGNTKLLTQQVETLNKDLAVGYVPVGTIVAYSGPIDANHLLPEQWMLCNGTEMNRKKFESLFAAIGTAWGSSDANTFSLPDLRGVFLRGANLDADGVDPDAKTRVASHPGGNTGNAVGTYQADVFLQHIHPVNGLRPDFVLAQNWRTSHSDIGGFRGGLPERPSEPDAFTGNAQTIDHKATGGAETRPKNVAVNWVIRVK